MKKKKWAKNFDEIIKNDKKIDYILFLSKYTQHKFNKLKYPTKGAKKDIIHPIIPLPKKKHFVSIYQLQKSK